jgi:hypothetical protein
MWYLALLTFRASLLGEIILLRTAISRDGAILRAAILVGMSPTYLA